MKTQEMRVLGRPELEKQLEEAHKELFNLRFRSATKQLVNHREIGKVKKNIARMKTVLCEWDLAGKA